MANNLSLLSNSTAVARLNSILPPSSSDNTINGSNGLAPVQGAAKYVSYIVYTLMLFFGIFGNLIVFYVLGYRKKKRNPGDIYILSLALADLLAALNVTVFLLNDAITDFSGWIYGDTLCFVFSSTIPATMCASGWFLALISLDRYRIISRPMAETPRRSLLYCSVAFVWISSIGVVLPFNLKVQVSNNICSGANYKVLGQHSSLIQVNLWVVYSFVIPNIIIVIIYSLTARALKANTLKHENNMAVQQRNKQNARIVRMFIIIVVVFFLLTIPYAIFCLYASYTLVYNASNSNVEMINKINYILLIPASANCCVNPLIYAKMQREINSYARGIIKQIKNVFWNCCSVALKNTPISASTCNLSISKVGKSGEGMNNRHSISQRVTAEF